MKNRSQTKLAQDLARRYPTLLADGQRMNKIGIEDWIQEQEERRRSGFAYADVRCQQP